jgi:hypothetical protein
MTDKPGIDFMSYRLKILGALAVSAMALSAPAKADYVIMEDTAFPSVLFFEFEDDGTYPEVISAPIGAPVTTTPQVSQPVSQPVSDPALQPDETMPIDDGHGGEIEDSSVSLEEQRASDFATMSESEMRRTVEQNAIDNRILQETELR